MLREDRSIALTTEYPFRIVAVGVSTPAGDRVVLVGGSLMPAHESMETEIVLLAFGYPLLLLAVGTATAWFTGRSLRAVEAVRRRVAVITAEQLHERVPVPAARDEISHLAETMNAMLDRLQAAVAAQRRFVADASHELRSPLSTVQLGLELLHGKVRADTPLDEAAVATLRAEAERLEQLVADLLLLARTDERQTGRRADEVDLDDIVDAQARRLANRPDLTVAVAVAPVRVRGDREQLTRAVRNLVDNAARHATTGVGLRLSVAGQSAQIEVADDGPGIPVADRGRVFERFVRLGESRDRDGGGTGLGLAIVREVVASHGGTVGVYDTPGGGATIRITVPLEVPRPATDRPASASGRTTTGRPSPQPSPATSR
jgi:signal transduction histidine kinase